MAWAEDVSTAVQLQDAVNNEAVSDIKLTEDISLTSTLTFSKTTKKNIDLNGHKITADGCRAIWIEKSEGVTITSADSASISVTSIDNADKSVIRLGCDTSDRVNLALTIGENVTVQSEVCYGITLFGEVSQETLVVNGAVNTKIRPAISGNGDAKYRTHVTSITIGETAVITTEDEVSIYHPQKGALIVNGKVTGLGGIEMKAGSLEVGDKAHVKATQPEPSQTVNGNGTSTRGYAVAIVENGDYAGVSTVAISAAADIQGPIAYVIDSPKNADAPVTTFTGDGCVKMVADVAGMQYASFADAVKQAPVGANIKLLEEIALTETINVDKNLTFDLNGHNIKATNHRALWVKAGDVKITGSGTISTIGTIADNSSVIRLGDNEGIERNTSLTIGENVTVQTDLCYGITAFGTATKETLTLYGKVATKVSSAIGGNGNDKTNGADVNVMQGAEITTDNDVAIFHPQNGALSVDGQVIGAGGIEIKAGSLTVGKNAVITATGTPSHNPNGNGTSSSGYAIAIVENSSYAGVSAVSIDSEAKITGPIANLYDSANATTQGVTLTGLTMVAAIGDDKYASFKDAFNLVPTAGTVSLIKDMELTAPIEVNVHKAFNFDLADHNITATGSQALWIKDGDVTLKTATEATISATGASGEVIRVGDNTGENRNVSLIVGEKVTILSSDGDGIATYGSMTRESVTVAGSVSTKGIAITGKAEAAYGNTTITVSANGKVSSSDNVAIYHPQSGKLVVEGTVMGKGGIEMKGGDLTVYSGAKITATDSEMHHSESAVAPSTSGYAIVIVENANFTGVGKVDIDGRAMIDGPVASIIDSKHSSVPKPEFIGDVVMVAETASGQYAKLDHAVAAAQAEGTVTLLEDITTTAAISIDKKITVDFNQYTITGENADVMSVSGNATLKNGTIVSNKKGISISNGTVALQDMIVTTDGVSLTVSGGAVTADKATVFTSTAGNAIALTVGKLTLAGKAFATATTDVDAISTSGAATAILTVSSTAEVSSDKGTAIDWQVSGTLTIEGGKISGNKAVVANNGTVTIKGGTFTAVGDAVTIENGANPCIPSLKGGTFISTSNTGQPIVSKPLDSDTRAKHFVEGDYFNKPIAPVLCAEGYIPSTTTNGSGMFYLVNELLITDATIWEAPDEEITLQKVSYTRSTGMGNTKFGTLCLPFSIALNNANTTVDGLSFYRVDHIDVDKLYIEQLSNTTIEAGTPVVFVRSNTNSTSFTITCKDESHGVTIKSGDALEANNLVGTFTKLPLDNTTSPKASDVYYLNSDAFHKATNSLTVPAFRAYIKFSASNGSGARPDVLNIFIDDETEDLQSIMQESAEEMIFDLQGNLQEELKPGFNLVKMKDGRTIKVYVK